MRVIEIDERKQEKAVADTRLGVTNLLLYLQSIALQNRSGVQVRLTTNGATEPSFLARLRRVVESFNEAGSGYDFQVVDIPPELKDSDEIPPPTLQVERARACA